MKATILILITLCVNVELHFSQNFLPLKVGNKYMYSERYAGTGPGGGGNSGIQYGSMIVEMDTVIGNDTVYRLPVTGISLPGRWYSYRQSEQKLYVFISNYDSLQLAVDFTIPKDSQFTSYITGQPLNFTSNGIFSDTIFGVAVQSFSMYFYSSSNQYKYTFSSDFGISSYFRKSILGVYYSAAWDTLKAAIIDTNIFNNFIVKIDTLFPLINRPIQTFPFVLRCYYSTPYPSLIDSFYVDILLTRGDSIVNSWRLPFQNNQLNMPIVSSMLEVGDIIKLRTKITDKSIFNNYDYYPDSGYAEIEVLAVVNIIDEQSGILEFELNQNYPNPFNPSTVISYQLPVSGDVTLKVYDVLGREVATLIDEYREAGYHEVEFNSAGLASGIYYYQLNTGSFIKTKKMVLLR